MYKLSSINSIADILNSPIEYLTGVTAQRGELLRKELNIHNFHDLLNHFPFRHIDKTNIDKIGSLGTANEFAYIAGTLLQAEIVGEGRSRRMVARLKDDTGTVELVWFQGINWIEKILHTGHQYLAFGRLSFFMGLPQIAHPDLENYIAGQSSAKPVLDPVYPSTEKLKARGLNGNALGKITRALMERISEKDLPENLTASIIKEYKFISRYDAYKQIHFPASEQHYHHALRRLKFDELFFAQLRLQIRKMERHRYSKGFIFKKTGEYFENYYKNYLPFELTNAQKKVLKEIRKDTATGRQMNRLLQGDVGSGKTIVALLCMLIAAGNTNEEGIPFQSVLMAPTEILAQQHYETISTALKDMPVNVRLLTGSTKTKQRKEILQQCEEGSIHILLGTHAVIEDKVTFKNLAFAVIDEQHKFGVAQRAHREE